MIAAALDELGDAAASQRAERGVGREAARAARELRSPVHLVPKAALVVNQILGARPRGCSVRRRVTAEGDAGVVGHVEPFVGVDRPRIGEPRTGYEVTQAGARGRPQPEGAVQMHPRPCLAGRRHDLG